MPHVIFRELVPGLLCLLPHYADDGTNGTMLYLSGGRTLFLPNKTKTVLRQLAREFAVDLQAAREIYARYCHRGRLVPVVLLPSLVLLPVHSRQALAKDDGATGYLVFAQVAQIVPAAGEQGQANSQVWFVDGSHIFLPHGYARLRLLLDLCQHAAYEAANLTSWGSSRLAESPEGPPQPGGK
jgi:hypothetical protein